MDSDLAAVRHRLQTVIQRPDLDSIGREAYVQAGVRGYENARNDGLCHEGAWECALGAARELMAEVRSSS